MSDPTVTSLRSIAVAAYGPTVLASTALGVVTPILALTALELGAGVAGAAVVVGLLGIGTLVGDLPAGALAGRFGERTLLIAAACVEAVGFAGCALARSIVALGAAVLLVGLAGSVFGLARHAYLSEAVPLGLRARALSTLGGMHRVGLLVGPFLGAAAVTAWGHPGAYAVAACASLAAAGLVAVARDLAAHARDRLAEAPPAPPVWRVLADRRRVLATLGVGILGVQAARAARMAIVPLWAEAIGLDAAATSLVFGISGVVDLALFYPAGWVMDRFGRAHVAVPSMAVLGLGLLVVPFAGTFWGLVAVATVLAVGNGVGSGLLLTLGADAAPEVGRAQFLSGWRLLGDVGVSTGPLLISAVTAIATLGAAAVVCGLLALAGAGWLAVWVPRYDPLRGARAPAQPTG